METDNLREYFVAAAVQGLCANPNLKMGNRAIVNQAFTIADLCVEKFSSYDTDTTTYPSSNS